MATVELRFSALPEHVRTARLVAAAVARRAGVDEAVLDEVRLAVGEACTRAVGLHQNGGITAPVKVALIDEEKQFSIEVGDEASHAAVGGAHGAFGVDPDADEEDEMGLAVISGLVDDVEVRAGADGGLIRMTWPTTPPPVLPLA
ncbi:ATP-binding protein [Streptomyces griseoviridis]|jgi:anti-sigma regulatory factor (Ser/Thr protein kinase)|uniref:Anti-sigma regulatory factor (Ser/Thr protein kinase) n=3 Tax=Streptomyces TaxID=1883 RepID=A0ABT9LHN6_STRGD|nr:MULTISPECIES: ATP-binding protein [Streptomyces]MDP9683237.1 anti-sigma regulatory factor (Ser/Thr protein kinase) [Streptomyces griseoviridis]GGS56002.1 anti-sigma regulatory factor [Streptomyces niveoruber]GGT12222.1 anti-sigma regulatory factor [Streptomyces griseoviridis]GGU27687.1 anti-sigma regulatory factor [Streptomyces daghestanicus]GHI31832.1 anti-sigma regulatory factor [Streptomyces daghestanicus]